MSDRHSTYLNISEDTSLLSSTSSQKKNGGIQLFDDRQLLESNLSTTPTTSSSSSSSWRIELRHLMICLFLFSCATTTSITIKPNLILHAFSNSASQAAAFNGFVLSIQSILSIILSPLCGAVSDVIGRKTIFLMCHTGEFLSALLLSQFPTSLYALFFANILVVSTAVYFSVIQAIIADIASKQSIKPAATYYGYIGGIVGTCFLFGPALGGFLEERVYPLSSLHLAACFVALAFSYTFLFLPETLQIQQEQYDANSNFLTKLKNTVYVFKTTNINPIPRALSFLSQTSALKYLAYMFCSETFVGAGLQSIIFIYLTSRLNWGPEQLGLYLTAFGFSLFIGQVGLTRFSIKVLGEKLAITLGCLSFSIGLFSFAIVQNTKQMYMILVVATLGFIVDPAVKGIIARQAPSHLQGGLQGSFTAVGNVVKPISPLITNVIFSFGASLGFSGLSFVILSMGKLVSLYFARIALSSDTLL